MRRASALLASIAAAIAAMAVAMCAPYEEQPSASDDSGVDAGEAGSTDGSGPSGDADADAGEGNSAAPKRIFSFGGVVNSSGTVFASDAWAAPILADGSLGRWERTPELDMTRFSAMTIPLPDGVIAAGGNVPAGPRSATVLVAPLAPLGAWTSAPPLPGGRAAAGGAYADGRVYITGGFNAPGVMIDQISTATVAGTAVAPFETANTLPDPVAQHVSFIFGSRLYVAGGVHSGDGGNVPTNNVVRALIGSNGLPQTWQASAGLPDSLWGLGAAVVGPRVFVLGGAKTSPEDPARKAVAVAEPASDGSLSWALSTPMPVGVLLPCVVVTNDTIYVLGGFAANFSDPNANALDQVAIGRVAANGALTWTASEGMPQKRASGGCAAR
jgi:N-acetylneuraminic acid mutarotase